jgi:hypothetical protein
VAVWSTRHRGRRGGQWQRQALHGSPSKGPVGQGSAHLAHSSGSPGGQGGRCRVSPRRPDRRRSLGSPHPWRRHFPPSFCLSARQKVRTRFPDYPTRCRRGELVVGAPGDSSPPEGPRARRMRLARTERGDHRSPKRPSGTRGTHFRTMTDSTEPAEGRQELVWGVRLGSTDPPIVYTTRSSPATRRRSAPSSVNSSTRGRR